MYRRIEQQAGFIEFAQLHFDEARDLFIQGQLDAREVRNNWLHDIANLSVPLHSFISISIRLFWPVI